MLDDLLNFKSITLPEKKFRAIGIDLGTTNSTVAEFSYTPGEQPKLRCIEIDQDTMAQGRATHILVPSMVALIDGKMFIGEGAKRLRSDTNRFKLDLYKNIFWECKNHMGLKRTYHKAPESFNNAQQIASKILGFLLEAAENEHDDCPIIRTVITVPASFQAAQRQDTLDAAIQAGISINSGDLLDEPMAAFLDYINTNSKELLNLENKARNLLVFDFGGGTCDVAVFKIKKGDNGTIESSPLAVSRYHRLGGGDIDKAILYEVLIPQIIEQNKLEPFELSFEDKTKFIEPRFLSIAEMLKTGLCREIAAKRSFSGTGILDKEIKKFQPGVHTCTLKNEREIRLDKPFLTSTQFEKLLEPFLDTELIYARETEYRMTSSIFGPLTDCIDRAGLGSEEIDFCLMVGGSSLIPQVQDAVDLFFENGTILYFADADATQAAVARGAACQALSLALTGKGIIKTVIGDTIKMSTENEPIVLLEKGTHLPFPADKDWNEVEGLAIPENSFDEPLQIRIELLNSDDHLLTSCIGGAMPPVEKGQPIVFKYRMDENQILHCKLNIKGNDDLIINIVNDNPITNTINPNQKREKIDKLEEEIRTSKLSKQELFDKIIEIATLYSDIKQYEKAVGVLQALIAARGSDSFILNKIGIICGNMGDFAREEKYYLEASNIDNDSTPLFNLALARKNRGKHEDALKIIEQAISLSNEAPYISLKALILDKLGRGDDKNSALLEAFTIYDPLATLNDWELGWYLTAAKLAGDRIKIVEAEEERKKRSKTTGPIINEGYLPARLH